VDVPQQLRVDVHRRQLARRGAYREERAARVDADAQHLVDLVMGFGLGLRFGLGFGFGLALGFGIGLGFGLGSVVDLDRDGARDVDAVHHLSRHGL